MIRPFSALCGAVLVSFVLSACSGASDPSGTGGGSSSTGGGSGATGGGAATGGGSSSTGGGSGSTGGGSATTGGGSGSTGGGSATTGGGSGSTGGGSATTGGGSSATGGGGGGGSLLSNGQACSTGNACQSSSCVDGVCCATECTGTCVACSAARTGGTDGVCAPLPDGTVCRAAAGVCDQVETCSAGTCPADSRSTAGTVCRASSGVCDHTETCNGTDVNCPSDALFDAGVTCRATGGVCDVVESCTGASAQCPSDALADAGTVCRAALGVCDAVETCSGTSALCPSDSKKSAATPCRPAAGPCDIAELCTGSTNDCPAVDTFQPNTSLACAPYRCTGTGAQCTTSCTTDSTCASTVRSICVNTECQTARIAFVTSNSYAANFGGVDAGNAICQAHAADAGLGANFKVWLSQPGSSPNTTFTRDGGIFIRLGDKGRVALSWADLTNGNIGSTIGYTEKVSIPAQGSRSVWTGTNSLGNTATYGGTGGTNTHCANWTDATNTSKAVYGACDSNGDAWSENFATTFCNLGPMRLYCFEQ